ncbi:MAG TPA: hypothetical protein VFL93_01055 [Longimicrobiaceae bacterium]|jgi:hypothetical protein|nr:hypothetical protein [Longimicrobiaceae bacterium]
MNYSSLDRGGLRHLVGPLYATAVMLVVIPLSDLGGALGWKMLPHAINWRTGAVGLFSGTVLTPALGLVIAVITASLFGHRWAQRVLTVVVGLAALVLFAILAGFILDAIQLRAMVADATMRHSFTAAVVKATINLVVAAVTLAIVCVGAFRAGRQRDRAEAATKRPEPAPTPLLRTPQRPLPESGA